MIDLSEGMGLGEIKSQAIKEKTRIALLKCSERAREFTEATRILGNAGMTAKEAFNGFARAGADYRIVGRKLLNEIL